MPEGHKEKYKVCKETDLTRGRKSHWINSAYEMGLRNVDSERGGVTYNPSSPIDVDLDYTARITPRGKGTIPRSASISSSSTKKKKAKTKTFKKKTANDTFEATTLAGSYDNNYSGTTTFEHYQQELQQQQQQQQQQQPMISHSMSHSQPNNKNPNMNLDLLAPPPPPQMMMMMNNEIAPSVVSSATGGHRSEPAPKRKYNEEALAKVTDPAERRRYERNLREQQRSSKISTQIKELREVLSECNVPFKPNKYSILLKVVEYIKQLQSRAIMLDAEHQKLITTVQQTNEMITNTGKNNNNNENGGETSDTTMGIENDWRHGRGTSEIVGSPSRDSELYFVKGIDYRGLFDQCPTAMGIAALDGRILECNTEFQSLLGYTTHEDLLKQSLFNLVHNHQDIFRAMAQMLKTAEDSKSNSNTAIDTIQQETTNNASSTTNNDDSPSTKDRFWTGPVTSKQNIQVRI